jgi:DNA repair protein RecN (Recombination protein N)
MLKSIYIDNYALIERLEIELQNGLSIITGETGAGKSILLGAMGLLLGKRADTSVLKEENKKCIVEAVFEVRNYGLEGFFAEHELDYQTETIIRREISNTGKSRAFINDSPVNLDILQELAVSLIDIHSQNQNLSLNSEAYIRWIVDSFAGISKQVEEYTKTYLNYLEKKRALVKANENYERDKANADFINHQYTELTEAKVIPGELQELEEEASLMNHSEEIKSALENCLNLLTDEEKGILRGLKTVNDYFIRIATHYPKVNELLPRTDASFIDLKDISTELSSQFAKIDFDPSRLEFVNKRIDLLQSLFHKHKVKSVEELISLRDQFSTAVKRIESGDYEIEQQQKALYSAEEEVKKLAQGISKKRTGVFVNFESKIQELLHNLGMKNARFLIHNEITDPTETGIDKIQFLFSANANISPQNIAKVASGGELSRLMLAIKYSISKAAGLPTIIFDEIDTGVSGEIADKVGRLIKEMASDLQVINITHLPQVASKGDHHFVVYKESVDSTTITKIRKLNDKERLNEIARMLSGDSVTHAAIENARVLLGQ